LKQRLVFPADVRPVTVSWIFIENREYSFYLYTYLITNRTMPLSDQRPHKIKRSLLY